MLLSFSFWYVYEAQGILFLCSTFKIRDVFLAGEINMPCLSWGFPFCLSFCPQVFLLVGKCEPIAGAHNLGMRFLSPPRGLSQLRCRMCELWLLPPVASYFERGQKIAAFGMEMEEQRTGRGKCAYLNFQVLFTLVAKGTPCGDVELLPICRCAPKIVVI